MKRTMLIGIPVAALLAGGLAHAETQGMDRRDDRRDTRQEARDVKQECKDGDTSRAECRQDKRDTKQDGRHGDGDEDASPETNTETQPQE